MHLGKRTKIVATIGPATESQAMLEKLARAGLNVIRMNFSHGDFAEHQRKVDNGRLASKATGIPLAFLQDLSGPKIRIGDFGTTTGRITLKRGQRFVLTTKKIVGDENKVYVNYSKLPKEVKVGGHILLDDGKKKLLITDIKGEEVICKVLVGGDTKGRRGVNLPGADLSISSLTAKDKKDLEFGVANDVDFFALSFVRKPKDILELRNILKKKGSKAGIIAKIETPQAVKHIDEIIELSDGIMVARGDLAIEVPTEDVPLIQKMIINKCNLAGKPVITATQMLESMIKSPVPTRAEVSDIANAILDGTDAIMLSEETTLGEFPLEAVEVMSRVAIRTEKDFLHEQLLSSKERMNPSSISGSIAAYAVRTAKHIGARYIISFTNSGYSSRLVSRHRPHLPILAFTPFEHTYRKLVLSFGVWPFMMDNHGTLEDAIGKIDGILKKNKLVKKGDNVVITCGRPFGKNRTNTLTVEDF